jgi:hypothetical protein
MALAPTLASIEALYRKAERESYRAYHARKRLHKADHFFNFCVTAHSLRDYFFERKAIPKKNQTLYHQLWDGSPSLVAVGDIANTSKHFTLRSPDGKPRTPRTRRVRTVKNDFADVFQSSSSGALHTVIVRLPDVTVTLSDGKHLQLYFFMEEVLEYWRSYLTNQSIRIRRQSLHQLIGQTDRQV